MESFKPPQSSSASRKSRGKLAAMVPTVRPIFVSVGKDRRGRESSIRDSTPHNRGRTDWRSTTRSDSLRARIPTRLLTSRRNSKITLTRERTLSSKGTSFGSANSKKANQLTSS